MRAILLAVLALPAVAYVTPGTTPERRTAPEVFAAARDMPQVQLEAEENSIGALVAGGFGPSTVARCLGMCLEM